MCFHVSLTGPFLQNCTTEGNFRLELFQEILTDPVQTGRPSCHPTNSVTALKDGKRTVNYSVLALHWEEIASYQSVRYQFFIRTIVHSIRCIRHWNKRVCGVIFVGSNEIRLSGSNVLLTARVGVSIHRLLIGHVVVWHLTGRHHWLRVSRHDGSVACCVRHLDTSYTRTTSHLLSEILHSHLSTCNSSVNWQCC